MFLRILIFAPYFAPHVGGVENFVSELNEVLLRDHEDVRITVFTAHLPPAGPEREELGARYRVVRYPAFELIPNFPVPALWRRSFWRALRTAGPRHHDVFVSHTRFFVSSTVALGFARLSRRPLLHVEHGSDFVQLGSHLPRLAARAYDVTLGRLVLRRADAVVAISRAAAAFVRQLAGRDAVLVYRGIWPHRLSTLAPDASLQRAAAGRTVVSFVGRLIDGKGVDELVRAFAEVQDAPAILCVIGDGPRRADLEQLAGKLRVKDRVLFRGYLNEADALSAILASDVIVNPSHTEGLPTTVLEAALLGRAILATDVGGTAEIVTDGQSGVLVPPRDVPSLARQLRRLIGDPSLRERLSAAAQADASERFDWGKGAETFREVAERLVASLNSPQQVDGERPLGGAGPGGFDQHDQRPRLSGPR